MFVSHVAPDLSPYDPRDQVLFITDITASFHRTHRKEEYHEHQRMVSKLKADVESLEGPISL